jgi:hypothetical protein
MHQTVHGWLTHLLTIVFIMVHFRVAKGQKKEQCLPTRKKMQPTTLRTTLGTTLPNANSLWEIMLIYTTNSAHLWCLSCGQNNQGWCPDICLCNHGQQVKLYIQPVWCVGLCLWSDEALFAFPSYGGMGRPAKEQATNAHPGSNQHEKVHICTDLNSWLCRIVIHSNQHKVPMKCTFTIAFLWKINGLSIFI